MTKCLREKGDINNFREQKAGNKFESKLGNKGTKFKILSHLNLNQICISKMTTYRKILGQSFAFRIF